MTNPLDRAISQLYTAKWNIPKAAAHCGIPNYEMEEIFTRKLLVGELPPPKVWGPEPG